MKLGNLFLCSLAAGFLFSATPDFSVAVAQTKTLTAAQKKAKAKRVKARKARQAKARQEAAKKRAANKAAAAKKKAVSKKAQARAKNGSRACSAQKMKELLAPATSAKRIVRLDCSVNLKRGNVITKQVYIEGAKGSGITFNCNGAQLNGGKGKVNYGKDMFLLRSLRPKGKKWQRLHDVTIKNCRVFGSIRILGLGANGENKFVRASSHSAGHTRRAQDIAPTKISLSNLTLTAQGRIPLYISPGTTRVNISNSQFKGRSVSVAVYLDAESAYNSIINNRFNIKTSKRELIAIDGSANNVISRNVFSNLANGGIYLYRNCGEGGTVRHQTPHGNKITKNGFYYKKFKGYKRTLKSFGRKVVIPAIWVGSRNGNRPYCDYDKAYKFGSGKNNGDLATKNVITGNQIIKRNPKNMIKMFSKDNTMSGNVTVKRFNLR